MILFGYIRHKKGHGYGHNHGQGHGHGVWFCLAEDEPGLLDDSLLFFSLLFVFVICHLPLLNTCTTEYL